MLKEVKISILLTSAKQIPIALWLESLRKQINTLLIVLITAYEIIVLLFLNMKTLYT